MPVCASGDRRRNVACVLGCAKVRGLPVRQIKSGWFPADDVYWSTTVWSIVSGGQADRRTGGQAYTKRLSEVAHCVQLL